MGHGVDVKTLLDIAAQLGILFVLCAMLWYLVLGTQKSQNAERERNSKLNEQMATIIGKSNERLDAVQVLISKESERLDKLTETLTETSAAKELLIEQNIRAVETNRTFIEALKAEILQSRTDFQGAIGEMRGAQQRIVNEVNGHTDTQVGLTTGAVLGVQGELTRQVGQTEAVKREMTDLRRDMLENGDKTRQLIIEQLKSINERLDAMQQKAEQRDSQMAKQLHQLSTDLSSTLLLITAPKPVIDLKTDAGTPLPVDVPKEELK